MRPLGVLLIGALIGAGATVMYLSQLPLPQDETTVTAPTSTTTPAVQPSTLLPAPPGEATPQATPAAQPANDAERHGEPPPSTPGAAAANWAAMPLTSGDSIAGSSGSSGSGSVSTSPVNDLLVPVAGVKAKELSDTFNQARGEERHHEALDILAPRGTPVVAAADSTVVKLFTSKPGGLTVYAFDPSERYSYYYAHLDHYANSLQEGQHLKKGELIGYVGTTGNADPSTPHLHFAVFELGPEKHWWQGAPLNPYPMFDHQ